MGSADPGSAPFTLSFVLVTSGWVWGVFAVFLARFREEVGPWIHVLAPDWSNVCFLGSMRCHGHVDSCMAARRHVAWCGSHRAHMISCAYLFHPNSKVGKRYINFGRLDEHVAIVQTNLAFEVVL
jgi:hypothetical protein